MLRTGISRIGTAMLSFVLLLELVLGAAANTASDSLGKIASTTLNSEKSVNSNSSDGEYDLISYKDWKTSTGNVGMASGTVIHAQSYSSAEGVQRCTKQGKAVISTDSSSSVEWVFQAPETGYYNLTVRYCPVASTSGFTNSIERRVTINGTTPYKECRYIEFARSYRDKGTVSKDSCGNDVRPSQEEITEFKDYTLRDPSGYISENLCFYLKAGENRVGLVAVKGEMLIESLEFSNKGMAVSYADYHKAHTSQPDNSKGTDPLVIEGEQPSAKSDFTIVSVTDRSSCNTDPNSAAAFLLNTIGGSNWSTVGQQLTWAMNIKKDGYYTVTLRCKQDIYSGTISSRRLLLDGEVPFKEAEDIAFVYENGWQTCTLSLDGKPMQFYLTAGQHTLTLQVVLGKMADIMEQVSSALTRLNEDYLRILTYTGTSPDAYRDYSFDTLIPDVLKDMKQQRDALKSASGALEKLSSQTGENTSIIDQTVDIVSKMVKDPDTIARNFKTFKDDLSAVGTWITTYSAQPLQIDTIQITPASSAVQAKKESALGNLWFQCRIFFDSFVEDYSDVGSISTNTNASREITVWTATGRDQSEIIQRIADELFTPGSGIKVNLKLVSQGALLPNILAGTRVDVYLSAGNSDPVNFAIRGAVKDLTQFKDLDQVTAQFNKTAELPYTYKNHVYALPETLSFPVLSYRKDIFNQLGLSVPETWDDFYEIISQLQKNNMTVGIEWSKAFSLFLYQNGGSYYNNDYTASGLDSNASMLAFKRTTELYTTYGLPVEFNFASRFRSGEMPMGIMDYTMFNQLTVFAPEIKGLWGIALVPGTKQKDGSINHTTPTGGTAVIMPRTVGDSDAAWEFMKWWTSASVQSRYGVEMETAMGASARQPSANLKAVANLPWSSEEFSTLKEQWQYLQATPEIPGSYYTGRMLDFAFNSVYSLSEDSSEALEENVIAINEEISRKLKEFASVQ